MRFTIRHLLWFTLLAGIACWWWLPSGNDAKFVGDILFSNEGDFHRFQSQQSLEQAGEGLSWDGPEIDFASRDAVSLPCWKRGSSASRYVVLNDCPSPRSRGRGIVVLAVTVYEELPLERHVLSIHKPAKIFLVTPMQFYLIDGGVAAGLLTLAIGSLFIRRKVRR